MPVKAPLAKDEGLNTPKGRGGVVLYLDFDGVLHHENVWWPPRRGAYIKTPGYTLFEHAPELEDVLTSFPDVHIVLSTSWVLVRGFSRAAKRLSPTLRERVIGATFHTRMDPGSFQALPRGIQILNDVARRQPRHWVALDDDVLGWPSEWLGHLVETDEVLGISAPGVLENLRISLQRICQQP